MASNALQNASVSFRRREILHFTNAHSLSLLSSLQLTSSANKEAIGRIHLRQPGALLERHSLREIHGFHATPTLPIKAL